MTFVALASSPIYEAQGIIQIQSGTSGFGMISEYFNLGSGSTQVNSEVEIFRSRSISDAVIEEYSLNLGVSDATSSNPLARAFNFVLVDRLKRGLRTLRTCDVQFPSGSIDKKYYLSFADSSGNFTVTGPDGRSMGSGRLGEVFNSEELTFTVTAMAGPPGTRFRLTPIDPYETYKAFRENLNVVALGGSILTNLVRVSYRSTNASLASDAVNAIMAEYERRNTEWLSSTGASQTDELEARLTAASGDLREAENAIAEYKTEYGVVVLPEEARLAVIELSSREAEKVDINLQLSLLESIYSNLSAQLYEDEFLIPPALTQDPVIEQLAADHARTSLDIQDLLLDYTELHPQVIARKENLQSIRQNILNTLAATITGYSEQRGDIESVIMSIEDRMYAIPNVERDLLELTRNLEVAEELYLLLFKRLEEARLVESSLLIGNRVIDNAVPPLRPVAPSIRRNLLMGLGLGIVFGIFLAFIIEIADTRLRRPDQLIGYLKGSPVYSIRGETPGGISTAASTFALASLKCRDYSGRPVIAMVCPGHDSNKVREILEMALSELSHGIQPIFLVDTLTSSDQTGFFKADPEPGISEIPVQGEVGLQSTASGRINLLPPGSDPSGAYITNSNVTDFLTRNAERSELSLYYVQNFAHDPVLRGWTSLSCGVVLILQRNHELLQDIFTTLEALESDKTPLLAVLILD